MKKFILFILLLLPLAVWANKNPYGVYNATIANSKGIEYQKYDNETSGYIKKTIKKNTEVIVIINSYEKKPVYNVVYDDEVIEVKESDLNIVKDSFDCDDCRGSNDEAYYGYLIYIEKTPQKIISFGSNPIEFKKGPGYDFENAADPIVIDKPIETIYVFGEEGMDDYLNLWAYIKYNDTYGWIDLYRSKDIYYESDSVYLVAKKIDIKINGNVVGTIPVNAEISPNYFNEVNSNFYITYNGNSGFIDGKNLAYSFVNDIVLRYDHKLLKEPDKKANGILTIPEGSAITYKYVYYYEDDAYCVYTAYQSKNGWVCLDNGEGIDYVEHQYKPYHNPTTTTTTKVVNNNDLVNDSDLNVLLIGLGIIVGLFVIFIIVKTIKDKKNIHINEDQIEKESNIEEDIDN